MRFITCLLLAAGSFAQDRVLFLVGEDRFGAHETMPAFAEEVERRVGLDVEVRHGLGARLPDLAELDEFDLLVLYLESREPTEEQKRQLNSWFQKKKPVIALRSTTHAFADDLGWFPEYFGGNHQGHSQEGTWVRARTAHAILNGVEREFESDGGLWWSSPLAEGTQILMTGSSSDLPVQPVTWLYGNRLVTTLGTRADFEQEPFRELLANGMVWLLRGEVEADGAFGNGAVSIKEETEPKNRPEHQSLVADQVDQALRVDSAGRFAAVLEGTEHNTREAGEVMGKWRRHEPEWFMYVGHGDLLFDEPIADAHITFDAYLPDGGRIFLADRYAIELSPTFGTWRNYELTYSHHAGEAPRYSLWVDGERILADVEPSGASVGGNPDPVPGDFHSGGARHVDPAAPCDWGEDFTILARFRTEGEGTLISKCPQEGEWAPDAKALFVRGGRLVYDIGWVGALSGGPKVDDGQWHNVVLTSKDGHASLYLDGKLIGDREEFGAADKDEFVTKIGAASPNFAGDYDGDLESVFFWNWASPEAVCEQMSTHAVFTHDPAWSWRPAGGPPAKPGTPLGAPLRIEASYGARYTNFAWNPLAEVDHGAFLEGWGPEAYELGESIYGGLCYACHGRDGRRVTNPKARAFAEAPLQNGADPLSLYGTITSGFQDMPANPHLTPEERYAVIHYLREEFLKEQNPSQYFEVDAGYVASLPKGIVGPRSADEVDELEPRDFGPVLASQLRRDVGAALTFRLDDDATFVYDTQTMQSAGSWTGGFLDLSNTQHYKQRGEGEAQPGGEPIEGLEGFGWGYGGILNWDESQRPPRGLLPTEWLDYRGHYVHGDQAILSYAVDGREVLDSPGIDRSSGLPVFTHRLNVSAGTAPIRLGLVNGTEFDFEESGGDDQRLGWQMATRRDGDEFVSVALYGAASFGRQTDRLFASFGASGGDVLILRYAGQGADELAAFRLLVENVRERPLATLNYLTSGGPRRWLDLETGGELGDGGAYVLDTVELPEDNPWNAWVRTSALAFFDDGRAAVTTYGGDVWIVSGLDADLDQVTWSRFAAGLFEPMGVEVVNGKIIVTCRDRLTRLHDINEDGEADFYENFFPDPDVSPTFHAFNFDLVVDEEGYLYYAKAGQYTSYDKGGAIVKVAPDGRSHELHCIGLRTPNGMGILPDGRVTVSDNQGNWIPASKVSLTQPGGFYGVFPAINVGGPGKQTRDDFDPPVIWMPQSLDSSSGGQVWVEDERWGPLSGRLFHTSFGKGWLYPMSLDERGEEVQAAIWRMPLQFDAGLQRARVNPVDGQVWGVGLSGWQGPAGGGDGCLQRVRYTGEEETLLLDARVEKGGIVLEFSEPIDGAKVEASHFRARQWNYRWTRNYGSAHYSVANPEERGEDDLSVTDATVEGHRIVLRLPHLTPCHQLELTYTVGGVSHQVYFTVHEIPD